MQIIAEHSCKEELKAKVIKRKRRIIYIIADKCQSAFYKQSLHIDKKITRNKRN